MILFLSACASSDVLPSTSTPVPAAEEVLPTVTPACISPEPGADDINETLSFGEELDEGWDEEHAILDGRVSVTWQNLFENAVIHVEALLFPCGYDEPDLDDYFSDANWDAIFASYEDHEMIGECSTQDGLRLYEFEASSQGVYYDVNYWVLNDTATRVITVMMIFPFDSEALFEDHSLLFFPELTAC